MAAAPGAEVTVLSRTADTAADAQALGATDLLVTTEDPSGAAGRFDLVLDTISAPPDLAPYVALLGFEGTLSVLGLPLRPGPRGPGGVAVGDRRLLGAI